MLNQIVRIILVAFPTLLAGTAVIGSHLTEVSAELEHISSIFAISYATNTLSYETKQPAAAVC